MYSPDCDVVSISFDEIFHKLDDVVTILPIVYGECEGVDIASGERGECDRLFCPQG